MLGSAAALAAVAGLLPGQTGRLHVVAPAGTATWDPGRGRVVFDDRLFGLWDWDGQRFYQRSGSVMWAGEPGPSAFDPVRHRLLAVGNGQLAEWDGASWTIRNQNVPVDYRSNAVFDDARGRLVAYQPLGANPGIHEWDGTQWLHPPQVGAPAVRYGCGFAYDPQRAATVLYGGSDGTNVLSDCWSWDGNAWTQIAANAAPGPRLWPALAHDPSRAALVLYGGSAGVHSTWMLAGSTWINLPTNGDPGDRGGAFCWDGQGMLLRGPDQVWRLTSATWSALPVDVTEPQGRTAVGLAWDAARGEAVMFGGGVYVGAGQYQLLGDTWCYDSRWHARSPATAPTARRNAAMAWSAADRAVLLWGGVTNAGLVNDTWLWNGATWTLQSPPQSPPARSGASVCADPSGGVMLFGGMAGSGTLLADQWSWNGGNWLQQAASVRPSPRWVHVAAYDEIRARVVLTGGFGAGNYPDDTWEWDGVQWQAFPASLPSALLVPTAMAFRHETGRVALSAGWEWTGSAWSATGIECPGMAMVSDPGRGVMLGYPHAIIGRCIVESSDHLAHADRYGNGCALGAAPGITALALPVLGESGFTLALQAFAAGAPALVGFAWNDANQDLGNGCRWLLANPIGTVLLSTDAGGEARVAVPVPAAVHLVGLSFRAQAAVVDPASARLGPVTMSDGLAITVGR